VSTAFDLARTNDTMRVWSDTAFDAIVVANTEAANISEGLAAAGIWGLAPGRTIVLISGAIFVVVALIRRARVPKLQAEGAGL